jgi:enterochelin esterase-like enzyme
MNFINPPSKAPAGVTHRTFFSKLLDHEIGYNIYLPPGYGEGDERWPVAYHLHGWKGNESSSIWDLEKTCRDRKAITVFVNAVSSKEGYWDAVSQMESMIVGELIPHIDGRYRTNAARGPRTLSGFSMGGALAFYYAVKHPELFGGVTAYAGTYHHQYHKEYRGLGEPREKAAALYEAMMREERHLEENNILGLVRQNAKKIRGALDIKIHVGTADILICDNEILHLHLDSLDIPHEYRTFEGAGHEQEKIL